MCFRGKCGNMENGKNANASRGTSMKNGCVPQINAYIVIGDPNMGKSSVLRHLYGVPRGLQKSSASQWINQTVASIRRKMIALVTNQKKLPLVIRTADCISLVIYDKEKKVLATVHSGWRGTLNGIVNNTIDTMINKFNCNPSNIEAYLYPSIRNCHFEVDNDVYQLFKLKYNDYITKKDTKYLIDLQSIVKSQLTLLGITKITDSNICTYCNNDKYYSYRFNKTNERNYLIAYNQLLMFVH